MFYGDGFQHIEFRSWPAAGYRAERGSISLMKWTPVLLWLASW
ncbi:hypothetical protein GWL_41150 [Herbaspirillum sp. GW103]|nr:hypothetical protein GWL_41150 [Herbaspirillum sp. GW103]